MPNLFSDFKSTVPATEQMQVLLQMPLLVNAFDEEGRLVFWNLECERVTGYSVREALETPQFVQQLYPDAGPKRDQLQEFLGRGGHFRNWEWTLITRTGEPRTVAWSTFSGPPIHGQAVVWGVGRDVTEHHRTSEQLHSREDLLTAIVEMLPDHIYLRDAEGRYQICNAVSAGLLGLSPSQVLGFTPQQLMQRYPHARAQLEVSHLADERAWSTGSLSRYELRSQDWRGVTHHLRVSKKPWFTADGKRRALLAIAHEMTDLVAAQERVRDSESRYRLLADHSADIICLHHPDGRYSYVSPSVSGVLGYSPEELLGTRLQQYAEPSDRAVIEEGWARLLQGQSEVRMVHRFRHRDGHPVWLEALAVPLFGESQRLESLLTTSRDVTQRVNTESALATSEARLRLALSLTGTGIYDQQLGTSRGFFSVEYAQILGYADAIPPSFLDHWEQQCHPEDVATVGETLERIRQGQDNNFVLEYRHLRRDGSFVWVRAAGSVVERHQDTGAMRVIGTFQDISERKSVEIALREARDQLRELSNHQRDLINEERKRISRNVHDELGQLLTAMKIQIDVLDSQIGPNAQLRETTGDLRDLVKRAIASTRDVAASLRPAGLDLSLTAALEGLVEGMSVRSGLECTLVTDEQEFLIDPVQATELFYIAQESLTNVIRHAQASQVLMMLHVTEDEEVTLVVQDNGRGLGHPPEFESGHFGLLGIRERVLRLGGVMELHGPVGQGTTVTVRVPHRVGVSA